MVSMCNCGRSKNLRVTWCASLSPSLLVSLYLSVLVSLPLSPVLSSSLPLFLSFSHSLTNTLSLSLSVAVPSSVPMQTCRSLCCCLSVATVAVSLLQQLLSLCCNSADADMQISLLLCAAPTACMQRMYFGPQCKQPFAHGVCGLASDGCVGWQILGSLGTTVVLTLKSRTTGASKDVALVRR